MGRHNRATPEGEGTEFSHFVRSFRIDVRRITQDQFLEELKLSKRFNKQYLSKVETGKLRIPHDDFLQAVETATRKPLDELLRMCGAPEPVVASSPIRPFDLVFGHDLRSAPLYLALTDEGTFLSKRFRATSKAIATSSGSGWSPYWIGSPPLESEPESYAAPDVIDALLEQRIDVGGFPSTVIEKSQSRQDELMVVATIVNTVGPLNFVLNPRSPYTKRFMDALKEFSSGNSHSVRSMDTNMLGHIIKKLADEQKRDNSLPRFKIAVEKGTIAETALSDACEYAREVEGDRSINEATYGFPSRNSLLLHKKDFDELARKEKRNTTPVRGEQKVKEDVLLGTITWQPHATIFSRALEQKKVAFPLNYILNRASPTGRPRHMSYDLVVRRDALTDRNPHYHEFCNALVELITAIQIKAGYLNENVGSQKLPGDTEEKVATYYNLGSSDIAAEALGIILFDVQLSISSLEALRPQ